MKWLALSLCFAVTKLEVKRQRFRQRVTEYMDRAEKLKTHIEEEKESMKACLFIILFLCLAFGSNLFDYF